MMTLMRRKQKKKEEEEINGKQGRKEKQTKRHFSFFHRFALNTTLLWRRVVGWLQGNGLSVQNLDKPSLPGCLSNMPVWRRLHGHGAKAEQMTSQCQDESQLSQTGA
jgi:hypothetical protein